MTLLAWLLGLVLPACGAVGAHGLARPGPLDFARLERPATPNTALAAPADFASRHDLTTPVYPEPAAKLFARLRAVAAAEPRTYPAAVFPRRMQADWVVRSAVWNFPDLVSGQVIAEGADRARLILYSRSVYGRSDFGVNRARLIVWLAALAPHSDPGSPDR